QAADQVVPKESVKASSGEQAATGKPIKKESGRSLPQVSERVKALEQRYKAEQAQLRKKLEALQRKQQGSKDDPESIRQQHRKLDEQLSELRIQRGEEMRQQHLEHQQLIDAAREDVKAKVRERRGHGD
ncbi:MAG TPA: hypothetical protein PKW90_22680, partial [Myxococcota bacterium]|nr:hypothetical protein [Myxococcota bacterium]